MESSSRIRWETEGNTGILTLDHPPRNEMASPDFLNPEQLLEWSSLPEIKGIIIRGAGRHFSSGADLEKLFSMAEDRAFLAEKMSAGKALLDTIEGLNIPVIAEIGGACFGGGLEIALACHLRVCAENALFAFPEVNHQLIPGLGGTARLCALTGRQRALPVLLGGDTVDAAKALQIGLADRMFGRTSLHAGSIQMMQQLCGDKPKKVINTLMQAWHNSRLLSTEAAMEAETALFCTLAGEEYERRKQHPKPESHD